MTDVVLNLKQIPFKLHGEGRADPPGILSIHGRDGSFHIKAGILGLGHHYFWIGTPDYWLGIGGFFG